VEMHHDNMAIKLCPSTNLCVLKTMVGPGSSTFEVFLGRLAIQSHENKYARSVRYFNNKKIHV